MYEEFEVGQKVAEVNPYGRGITPRTVTRVMKRFIELDNGSKWGKDSYPYPRTGGYNTRYITAWRGKHDIKLEYQKLKVLGRKLFAKADAEDLAAVVEVATQIAEKACKLQVLEEQSCRSQQE
jgi:hypothetical protein